MLKPDFYTELLNDPRMDVYEYSSPLGTILLAADEASLKFCLFYGQEGPASGNKALVKKNLQLKLAAAFLDDIFSGTRPLIDGFMESGLSFDFSPFSDKEIRVYRELLNVPPGKTVSYRKLSFMAGIPRGARFVGNTMAKNVFPILVPCHRVVPERGGYGNYSSGVETKIVILKKEGIIL